MTRTYFGTDGVRGRVGEHPLTAEFALRLAGAAAKALAPAGGTVLIGKDTRMSGYMLESALEAGFAAAGVDVLLTGPIPTPAVAYLTKKLSCEFGIVISASHNAFEDNGIKFFDKSGGKLSDETETRIESLLEQPALTLGSERLGRVHRIDNARSAYQRFCSASIAPGIDLANFKVVVDCAHGAAYKVGPRILADLGAEVIPIGCSPNGRNINLNCGSTSPELLQHTVLGANADVGIALDGDADRLVMVDDRGQVVDGDQLLYILAKAWHDQGLLPGPVVGTVLSNLGLEQALQHDGIQFLRARVGDRYVLEALQQSGGVLGGETSGHLLCLDHTTTGDALVAALRVLSVMKKTGQTLAELAAPMQKYPQATANVQLRGRIDLDQSAPIKAALAAVEERLANQGRVVLRASGTEPVIRVMVEGRDENLIRTLSRELAESVAAAAA
ncbi:phosphoglucosamine mutase [Streptomyces sp. NPDC059552]|uniref:phosphoglucosamine mutase n=1 Tax=Streptomyces sp. NPDC059552 TaxID=3346862 RepID=UPI00369455C2